MNIICQICGKCFHVSPARFKIGHCKYCSRKCYTYAQKGRIPWNKGLTKEDPRVAKYLAKAVKFKKGYKHTKNWYRAMHKMVPWCRGKKNPFISGEKHYNWKGGRQRRGKSYISLYMPNHPFADKRGRILEHRYIMEQKIGRYLNKNEEVDHINGIKFDNRIENLRICSHAENIRNRKLNKNNTSGYKGVIFDKVKNKWMARLEKNGKNYNLGRFINKEDAKNAYNEGAKKYFGEFARLN